VSTPLTCCSIGVATDCSRAVRPPDIRKLQLNFRWNDVGNLRHGQARDGTAPNITMRMAMTIATMGR